MHVCESGWVCVRHREGEIVLKCMSEVECMWGVSDRREPKGMKSLEVNGAKENTSV